MQPMRAHANAILWYNPMQYHAQRLRYSMWAPPPVPRVLPILYTSRTLASVRNFDLQQCTAGAQGRYGMTVQGMINKQARHKFPRGCKNSRRSWDGVDWLLQPSFSRTICNPDGGVWLLGGAQATPHRTEELLLLQQHPVTLDCIIDLYLKRSAQPLPQMNGPVSPCTPAICSLTALHPFPTHASSIGVCPRPRNGR